jgi:hypothetical protein
LLRNVDREMADLPARYFRYVDDITLVGSQAEIDRSVAALSVQLEKLDLALHGQESSKWLIVSAATWLQGEHDFAEPKRGTSWMSLVGDLKRLLVSRPELREILIAEFAENDIRMPVPDYSIAIEERSYRVRLAELLQTTWFRNVIARPSVEGLIEQAISLRREYHAEASALLHSIKSSDAFAKKRLLPKIRYRFGRLAYLGETAQLMNLAHEAADIPTLRFQSAIAKSIATGDMSEVLNYGVNAVQAAAQPLHMRSTPIVIGQARKAPSTEQGLAVLKMNGLPFATPESINPPMELLKFAIVGADAEMMRSQDPYIRELACLHGVTGLPRHAQMLGTAFDRAEDITLDAIEQEHQSS